MSQSRIATTCIALLAVVPFWSVRFASAQLPAAQLHALSPPGGRQGTAVDVQLAAGADLDGASRLIFSHPGVTAVQKTIDPTEFQTAPQPVPGQFVVTIAADVPPGIYEARTCGTFGVSNPRAFTVGEFPEAAEVEENNAPEKANAAALGTTMNGTADANAVDFFKIALKKDQRIVLDCWAERIDSRMDATLVVLDAQGKELARDRDSQRRDPLIVFIAPADGEYFVKLYDFQYRGGAEYFYRLTFSGGPHVDFVFPPSGAPGTRVPCIVYGANLPGGQPAPGVTVGGRTLEQLAVEIEFPAGDAALGLASGGLLRPAEAMLDGFEYRLSSPQGKSNPYFLSVAAAPVVPEQEPNDDAAKPQSVHVPCEIVGRFAPRGDRDWFAFEAKRGDQYWIESISDRLGVGTDPAVLIQQLTKNDKGEIQATDVRELDDAGRPFGSMSFQVDSDDARARFVAPADATYRVLVRNLDEKARDDARQIYRLSIRQARPDFRMVAAPSYHSNNKATPVPTGLHLRRGGTELIDVLVERYDGFEGPVEVTALGLPAGVRAAPITVGANQDVGTLVLVAAEKTDAFCGPIQVVGQAKVEDRPTVRIARAGAAIWSAPERQPAEARWSRDLVLAVTDVDVLPFTVEIGARHTWEMSLAGKLEIPVLVVRRGDFKKPVTLTAEGLPRNVKAQPVTIADNASEGKFALEIAGNAAPGDFNFYVQAQTTISYRRDPRTAEQAAAFQSELEKKVAYLTTVAQAADAAKQSADKAAADTAAAAKQSADALTAATQKASATASAAKAAAEKLAQAATAAEKAPQDEALVKARQAAEQSAQEASIVAQAAMGERAAAEKAAADAQAAAKKASEDQAATTKAAADAAAAVKRATEAKDAAAKRAAETAKAAEAKDVNVFEPSTSVAVRVTPAPIELTAAPIAAGVKPGGAIELPIAIERRYGFAEPVDIEASLPSAAKGVTNEKLALAAGQSHGKLRIAATPDAAPGSYSLKLRAKVKFNGQDLQVEQTVPLVVTEK